MRDMLTLHCPLEDTDESVRRERFLTEQLLIPEQWIHEAKATRARRDGNKRQEALHLYRARYWNQCHRLLIQHLASGTDTQTKYQSGKALQVMTHFYPPLHHSKYFFICFFILPVDCIINDNHHYLEEFLEGLAVPEHSATIQDWDTAGRVYLDYIRVIKSLQDIQQVRRPLPHYR